MPSCLSREYQWVDVSAVPINGYCGHLVSLLYILVNKVNNLFCFFVHFCLHPPHPPTHIYKMVEITYLKWWEIFSNIFKPLIAIVYDGMF